MDNWGDHPVLVFDGVCNLCNRAVQYVIKRDKKKRFLFAALQSAAGRRIAEGLLKSGGRAADSVILYYRGKYYIKSGAVLKTAWLLGGFSRLLAAGLLLPPFLRNIVYDWVAAGRYRWFGRSEACMVPAPGLKDRFLS